MKIDFLGLPLQERRIYFTQAAIRRNLSPVILEKDFWVCWLLGLLFESKFSDSLVFKGGTSLSKVFGVIDRFSEDIDLSLSPEFLGLPDAGTTRNQANKWMNKAEQACCTAVEAQILPYLETVATESIGSVVATRFEYIIDPSTQSPVILFHYPSTQPSGFDYIKRYVKLEFGSLTDQQPTGHHPIRPWIADELPNAFEDWACDVVALELDRTFWEKATILHAEYHRPANKATPDRFSRHYADTAALADHPKVKEAQVNNSLRDRVVEWKSHFFGSSWANYNQAKPGSFRLVPSAERKSALRRDYQAMRDMYLVEPPDFDVVIEKLTLMENRINRVDYA
ncbi:MAG: nucleotidyl transferase AbiEii/AbiGii toxin family protein [Planctomycetota bacterium]